MTSIRGECFAKSLALCAPLRLPRASKWDAPCRRLDRHGAKCHMGRKRHRQSSTVAGNPSHSPRSKGLARRVLPCRAHS
jgi:hypothetical protein